MHSTSQRGKLPFGVLLYIFAACIIIAVQGFRSTCCYVEIERLRASETKTAIERGRFLFLTHCAVCHGEDAAGGDGPCLHRLIKTDDWLRERIRKGVKGRMLSFDDTLTPKDTDAIISFIRTLK